MISLNRLKETMLYNPGSGNFTWQVHRQAVKCGSIAGCLRPSGYRHIKINQQYYMAHRLAWFYVYGIWPELDVDHINGVRSDNRIENLRLATKSQNSANRRAQNPSGLKGISFIGKLGKWQASIKINDKSTYLGLFASAEEASAAYFSKAREIHGEFARAA